MSQVLTQILMKPESRLNLKFNILTKPCFRISTNSQVHNLKKISAANYWPNSCLKILLELQHQNLDQTLCSKSKQKFSFLTKPQPPNLQQIVANTILISNSYTTSTSFELASSHTRVTSIKFTKQEWVSQSVSQWQAKQNSNNIFWVAIFTCQGHINQVY